MANPTAGPVRSARLAAALALLQVDQEGGYSNLVLNHILKSSGLSPQDGAFGGALFYGVLERKLTLDFAIGRYSSKKLRALSPQVLEILRLGFYQILYMDSVPDSAAVNESVRLTGALRVKSASGFVNAVLRAFLRDGGKLPPCKGNRMEKLQVRYSCPQWLIRMLMEEHGEENALGLLEHSLGRPPLYARVNTTRISDHALCERLRAEGVEAQEDPMVPGCITLRGTAAVEELEAFREGLFHIQDKSSQLCAWALDPQPGDRVLDLCAAPGSKSFTMLERMEGKGSVTSCDIFPEKVKKIQDGARRLGLANIFPQQNDATVENQELGVFSRVLCDVPCSGMGIIARKPEIKYKPEEELRELPAIQAAILENGCRHLEAGGVLVYSTCTVLRRENEAVTEAFLKNHPEMQPLPLPEELQKRVWGQYDPQRWQVTLFPQVAGTDGFFFAAMKKVR